MPLLLHPADLGAVAVGIMSSNVWSCTLKLSLDLGCLLVRDLVQNSFIIVVAFVIYSHRTDLALAFHFITDLAGGPRPHCAGTPAIVQHFAIPAASASAWPLWPPDDHYSERSSAFPSQLPFVHFRPLSSSQTAVMR